MSKENEKISGNHLPSENELLFETWKQITQFMEEVKKVYLKFNFSIEESSLKAVEWGDKIFNRPEQVKKIIQQEWPLHLKELKINYLISDTQDKLERSGVPSSIAHEYAQKYAQEMVEVEKKSGILAWISGQNKIINAAKNNLQNLAHEHSLRNTNYVLPQAIQFADLYSIKDIYNYAKDHALRGDWFPFAVYMANQKGVVIETPPFSLDPVDYKKALTGDRINAKILWNNIFKAVGIAVLATFIYKSLKLLYKKYQNKKKSVKHEQYFTIIVTDSKNNTEKNEFVWTHIKKVLKSDEINNYKMKKYSEMVIKYPRRLSKENVEQLATEIQKELQKFNINSKVAIKEKNLSGSAGNLQRLFIEVIL